MCPVDTRARADPAPSPRANRRAAALGQVDRPLDLAKFDTDPYSLLTKDQVAAVVADPPADVSAFRKTTAPIHGCSWAPPLGANATASKPANNPHTLTELAESPARKTDLFEPWTETSINGLPAIVYHQRGSTDDCSVAVQVTDQQMLTFQITDKDLPHNYWAHDRCRGVAKMAEAVIGNLRQNWTTPSHVVSTKAALNRGTRAFTGHNRPRQPSRGRARSRYGRQLVTTASSASGRRLRPATRSSSWSRDGVHCGNRRRSWCRPRCPNSAR
ncbi:DUF3558 domain-containing protein [Amycolatopsis sp. NPDC004169]|uniref:DUF3558 domain-containing protein n=1 Tax=Amycolatopsis sp. NPDC004169 TaxID=3154453 RepID=UPI0033B20D68